MSIIHTEPLPYIVEIKVQNTHTLNFINNQNDVQHGLSSRLYNIKLPQSPMSVINLGFVNRVTTVPVITE